MVTVGGVAGVVAPDADIATIAMQTAPNVLESFISNLAPIVMTK
jgi:hypothetical protein